MSDNNVTIVGNATRDPELRFTPTGQAVVTFGVAHNRRWRDKQGEQQEQTGFYDVKVWGDHAENVAETVTRGMRVVVIGRLEQRSWEQDNGEKRSKVEIVADEVAPSLRWATASVTKADRRDGGQEGRSGARSTFPAAAALYDEEPF